MRTAQLRIDTILAEKFSVRETRRIKAALMMAKLSAMKMLTGFDLALQSAPDRNRLLTLAGLDFIDLLPDGWGTRETFLKWIEQRRCQCEHDRREHSWNFVRFGRRIYS
jgi:hypothetical protein